MKLFTESLLTLKDARSSLYALRIAVQGSQWMVLVRDQDSTFECDLCLERAKDTVLNLCLHFLYRLCLQPGGCKGWRADLTDKCVQFINPAAAK